MRLDARVQRAASSSTFPREFPVISISHACNAVVLRRNDAFLMRVRARNFFTSPSGRWKTHLGCARAPLRTLIYVIDDRYICIYIRTNRFRPSLRSASEFLKESVIDRASIARRYERLRCVENRLPRCAPENRSHSANWLNSVTTPSYRSIYTAHKEFVAPATCHTGYNAGYYFNRISPREGVRDSDSGTSIVRNERVSDPLTTPYRPL